MRPSRNRNWKRYRRSHDPRTDPGLHRKEPMTAGPQPHDPDAAGQPTAVLLSGVCIVAVEQYGVGPFGTMYLADLGAEVIKIEDPATGGDVSCWIPPGRAGSDSLFFEA